LASLIVFVCFAIKGDNAMREAEMSVPLNSYVAMWLKKPVLRLVYNDFFDRIVRCTVPGTTLEVGGGIGNLKEKLNHVLSSDIQFSPGLDFVADAQSMPFREAKISNIVMLDVLHHLEFPALLFREAARVLHPGGRLVLVEPAITLGSTVFYRFIHPEPVKMSVDPLTVGIPDRERDPYDSNQAIPTLIATRYRERFHQEFPELRIIQTSWFSFLAYPCSGGFKKWSLLNPLAATLLLGLERRIERVLGRIFGFRLLLVIERR
jgi:SAM-dependent methyltransferase